MKANTYRLKPGTTMQDILSIPEVSKGSASYVREGADASFKHWYFGHYHLDKDIDGEFSCLYNRVVDFCPCSEIK